MRASDEKLAAALREAGLEAMALQAEQGDYNEFFGPHALPVAELIAALEAARNATSPEKALPISTLIVAVANGEFDATKEEQDEWMCSDEGQTVRRELAGG